ncbi:MAG: endonuclease/exonuclease/phosphatase family protein [Clostridia bacterium]|nr:endonuclease/exonuclease/phosphatase family protein [Clostridia bacterium]
MNQMKKILTLALALLTVIATVAFSVPGTAADDGAQPSAHGAVELPTPLLITEVCFNPTYMEHGQEDLVSATADVFEFVEIYNPTNAAVSLKDAVLCYSKSGDEGEFKENALVAVSTSEMTVAPHETVIVCIYGKDAALLGYTYDSDAGIQAIFDAFGKINVNLSDSLTIEEFILAPKMKSGVNETVSDKAFNLDNESTNAVIRLISGETLLCEARYNADLWNRNICSVNMMYDPTVDPAHPHASVAFNETYPTPGYLYDNQYPDAVLTVDNATEKLLVFEYNICASESTQKHADGSAVTIGERMDQLERMISQYRPDVISLPEFNDLWLPEMKEYLASENCEYTAFGSSSQGKEFGKKDTNYKWDLVNLIMYNHNKYDCLDSGFFWCSKWPDRRNTKIWEDGTDGDLARCINWVILRDKETQAEFLFVSAHIDAKIPMARTHSTNLIIEKATELSEGRPVIMAGDWNCHESTEAYWNLHKDGYADARYRTDSVADMRIYSTMNKWGESTDLQTRPSIDHCIISKNSVMVNSAHRDMGEIEAGVYASDHNATVFDLSYVNVNAEKETTPSETESSATPAVTEPQATEPVATEPEGTLADATVEPSASEAETVAGGETATTTDTSASEGGCASMIATSSLMAMAIACAVMLKKRKA